VIEVGLDLGGYPVVLADTAGLRASADAVEGEGVRRARARAASADLRLIVLDATRPDESATVRPLIDSSAIIIANKIDLAPPDGAGWADRLGGAPASRLSVTTGEGLAALIERLSAAVSGLLTADAAPLVTRTRHRLALEACVAALDRFAGATLPELAAEDLRAAARSLGAITGRVGVDDVLDSLFREFCIGK
jgi:tRNA modification GTPase